MRGVWDQSKASVWWLIRHHPGLDTCPEGHLKEIAENVESALRATEENKEINYPKAYARRVTLNIIADHLEKHPRPLEDWMASESLSSDFTSLVDTLVAVGQELEAYSKKNPLGVQAFLELLKDSKQGDIAKILGVSQATVSRLIRELQEVMRKQVGTK